MSIITELKAHLECFETSAVAEIHKFIAFVENRIHPTVVEAPAEAPVEVAEEAVAEAPKAE